MADIDDLKCKINFVSISEADDKLRDSFYVGIVLTLNVCNVQNILGELSPFIDDVPTVCLPFYKAFNHE